MKFRQPFESRTKIFTVEIEPRKLKKIIDIGEKKFHFKWLTDSDFIISLNFSFGSRPFDDANYPNTKSDIIYYGKIMDYDGTKTALEFKTKSKYFLAFLLFALPLLILSLQLIIKDDFLIFIIPVILFPLAIFGLLQAVRSEENKLLRNFLEYLNDEINNALQQSI